MNLLYLVFGNDLQHYLQTNFSILSFLAQKKDWVKIHVCTDRPDMFQFLQDEINIIPLGNDTLKEWKGKEDFFWRIKIKAIQWVVNRFEGVHLLYLDGDTFLFGDINDVLKKMNAGEGFMHLCEGDWASLKTKTETTMWKQVQHNNYGGIKITSQLAMWNAGVVGLPGKNARQIADKALQVCDDMLDANVTRRLIEQYALSVALANAGNLLEASNFIGHYWSNKEQWNRFTGDFFKEQFFKKSTVAAMAAAMQKVDFKQFPVYVRKPNTNKRIKKLADTFFPDANKIFIPSNSNNGSTD